MNETKVFFDTNVLLYLLSADETKANRAEDLIASGGVISVQVLNEFASVAMRKLDMKIREIREVLATVRTVCSVRPIDMETHELGLDLAERHRFSVYDALIVGAALRAGCTVLYTEDLHDHQTIQRLTIRNPFIG
ncbi:MAG: PIN domain-containing protein [Candidatus Binataceae bacterium]